MRKITLAALAAMVSGSVAHSGSLTAPIELVAPIVAPPVTQLWNGPYAGGLVSFSNADGVTEILPGLTVIPNTPFSMTGIGYGGFIGLNVQRGSFVFGGEGAITFGNLVFDDPDFDLSYGQIIDLKARAGFGAGNALIYGVIGGSFSTMSYANLEFPSSGMAYGAGIDFALGEKMFIGGEYLVRDLTGTSDTLPPGSSVSATIQSAQLRVGWRF